jgi:D-tyrosyl-tRNA(Tyr) deacylase
MRVVLQRVARASVRWTADGGEETCNEIGPGLVVLAGVGPEDDESHADRLADKVARLRIFRDDEGRFNRSLEDVGGAALVVSQFTLYADATRGRRPSFIRAGDPARAEELYQRFVARLRERGVPTRTGGFGEHMVVSLDNDGPVTLALSTDDWNTSVGGR